MTPNKKLPPKTTPHDRDENNNSHYSDVMSRTQKVPEGTLSETPQSPEDDKNIIPKEFSGATFEQHHTHAPTDKNTWEVESIAANIVYQIGDALYEALPIAIAHEHLVKARQATNDIAIGFAKKLISDLLLSEKEKGWNGYVKDIDTAIEKGRTEERTKILQMIDGKILGAGCICNGHQAPQGYYHEPECEVKTEETREAWNIALETLKATIINFKRPL